MTVTAPPELTMVAAKVDDRLGRLFAAEREKWQRVDPRLAEAVDELATVVEAGGKRLRAAFVYWAWFGMFGGECDPDGRESAVVDVGAAFELLQAFALIHDDIMDDSDTRRGRPTVHVTQAERLRRDRWQGEPRRFGEGVAILVGDLSHAYADGLMAGVSPAARRVWDDLRIELNLGQYLDLRSAAARELDHETARAVSMFKSALYTIVRPLQLGACLDAPADEQVHGLLDRYGRPLGRAFQLRDDLLGVLGDEEEIGKPVGDDLREGKPTELVALAMERASAEQRELLNGLGRRDLSADDVAAIVAVFADTEAIDGISARISTLVTEACKVVDDLPFNEASKGALVALADYVAARNT